MAPQHRLSQLALQPRLTIGPVDDPYEREAERVAAAVMRMPAPVVQRAPVSVQRCSRCAGKTKVEEMCPSCAAKAQASALLQREAAPDATSEVSSAVEAQISALRGGGAPMSGELRAFMEPRFGHDFSRVRVHSDARAASLARSISALAFTVGNDVVFGAGQYRPGDSSGRHLIAHELTHVVQQQKTSQIQRGFLPIGVENYPSGFNSSPSKIQTRRRKQRQHERSAVKVKTIKKYIDLIRSAEDKLINCGIHSGLQRIKIISGIYYGTPWSLDYEVEKSEARNFAFQTYTGQIGVGYDPRVCLGKEIFQSIKYSQDVEGIDMGHVLIGLSSRISYMSRTANIPFQGATGLEIVTWVGDLGGATARVALDRVSNPQAGVGRYFRGTDYGSSSNLEGDIAAYVIASQSTSQTGAAPISMPESGLVADVLNSFFADTNARSNRCMQFLLMQGGEFSGRSLINRSQVEAQMSYKFESFGRWYMMNYLRKQGGTDLSQVSSASHLLKNAADDVAKRFIDWLLSRLPQNMPTITSTSHSGSFLDWLDGLF